MTKILDFKATASLLLSAQSLILTTHIHPDGDALGSTLGLAKALVLCGKKVRIILDDTFPVTFNFLPGNEFIERFTADTNLTADLFVVNDASSLDRIGNLAGKVEAPLLNIDHHISNTSYADYLCLDTKAAATGEIIFQLLNLMGVAVDKAIAVNLYVAIVTDCGYFKYANTTETTMNCAAKLLAAGISPAEISDRLETRTRLDMTILAEVLNSLSFFAAGKIATVDIDLIKWGDNLETDHLVQYPRYIEGVEIAVLFKKVAPQTIRLSMRSRNIDVSRIAVSLGGGGHQRAAGCTIEADLDTAKAQVIKLLSSALEGKNA